MPANIAQHKQEQNGFRHVLKKKKRIELTALKSRTERHLHHSFQRGSLYYPYTPALLSRRRIMQGKDFFIFYLKIWEGMKTKSN